MSQRVNASHIPESLYGRIVQIMPIVCVDLLILDKKKRILLVRRKNEPAQGQWWFPGGRVLFGETRIQAAGRKLKEECGLQSDCFEELFTEDCLLNSLEGLSHAVTTFFKTSVLETSVTLDNQSSNYAWRTWNHWMATLSKEEIECYFMKIGYCLSKVKK